MECSGNKFYSELHSIFTKIFNGNSDTSKWFDLLNFIILKSDCNDWSQLAPFYTLYSVNLFIYCSGLVDYRHC